MMQMHKLALSVLVAAALAACSSTKVEEPVKQETPPPAPVVKEQPKPVPPPVAPVATVDVGAQLLEAANKSRVVYFDFDSYVVKSDFQGVVDAHAKRLNYDKKVKLALEGHADERGGREYNLALGQKRAEAVAQSLSLLGVKPEQVEPVSFGKTRPAVEGHNEEAWAKNRRVELKDK